VPGPVRVVHGPVTALVQGSEGRLELLQGGQPLRVQVQAEKLVRQHLDEEEDVEVELFGGVLFHKGELLVQPCHHPLNIWTLVITLFALHTCLVAD